MAIINGKWVSLDRFQEPDEPDEFIVARDWRGEEITNNDYDNYFRVIGGDYVHEDDTIAYVAHISDGLKMIHDWEDIL